MRIPPRANNAEKTPIAVPIRKKMFLGKEAFIGMNSCKEFTAELSPNASQSSAQMIKIAQIRHDANLPMYPFIIWMEFV